MPTENTGVLEEQATPVAPVEEAPVIAEQEAVTIVTPPPPLKPNPYLRVGEAAGAIGLVLVWSLPVLLVAVLLRLWNFNQYSAYMDESSFILTGRVLNEQGQIYANALQWMFGSYLFPVLAGFFDQQGGLAGARSVSLIAGLVTVEAVIFITLGFFKAIPESREQARGDFAFLSKPMVAAMMAGLIVAIMPSALGLSGYATYDATAAAFLAVGGAAFVWARRETLLAERTGKSRIGHIMGLFGVAAVFIFLAFLAKYIVAVFLPALCLYVLFSRSMRVKGFLSFVLPLTIACAVYYFVFANDLNVLWKTANEYKDLGSSDWWSIYVWQRLDIIVLLVFGYWGLRQAIRDGRLVAPAVLWAGVGLILTFQQITRPDYDYWKHAIYIIIFMAPLVGWLWSDWAWWDEEDETAHEGFIAKRWHQLKSRAGSGSQSSLDTIENRIGGNALTEKPGSISLLTTIFVLLTVAACLWARPDANKIAGFWPSITAGVPQIQQIRGSNTKVLVDDSAVVYYLYNRVPVNNVTTPFFIDYKKQSGPNAYAQAISDKYYNFVVLDGGITPAGEKLYQQVRPLLQANPAYLLVYRAPIDATNLNFKRDLEIYRLLTTEEQATIAASNKPVTSTPATGTPTATTSPAPATKPSGTPASATTAPAGTAAPAATIAPATVPGKTGSTPSATTAPAGTAGATSTTAPATTAAAGQAPAGKTTADNKKTPAFSVLDSYNFDNGDEGWGVLPENGSLQPGSGVSPDDTVKFDNHNTLKFTPVPATKSYSVGVSRTGEFTKITMWVFIPADKVRQEVRLGFYYFDPKWNWYYDGFTTKVTPGQWTQLTFEVPLAQKIQQFGIKLVGFSGSVYIGGVRVE